MIRVFGLVTAVVLVLGSGLVHGLLTDRWAMSPEPKVSADKLAALPRTIGSWEGKEGEELSAQDRAIGEIAGYRSITYENNLTGMKVSVLILCGRPGPIGVHTPDVCFVGEGYHLVSMRKMPFQISPEDPSMSFVAAQFRKPAGESFVQTRVLWSWSATGAWLAPDSPRWTFAGNPALYKLYVVRSLQSDDEKVDEDPIWDFMKVFMPKLQEALFGAGNV